VSTWRRHHGLWAISHQNELLCTSSLARPLTGGAQPNYSLKVETCGGLGKDAIALLDVISGAASEHLSLWSQEDAAKEMLNSVAIAVQKGNAMTVLGAHAAAALRAA
jgi:hypothetical protein